MPTKKTKKTKKTKGSRAATLAYMRGEFLRILEDARKMKRADIARSERRIMDVVPVVLASLPPRERYVAIARLRSLLITLDSILAKGQ